MYPSLDFKNKFHIDHIFPKSLFNRKNLLRHGIPEDKVYEFIENVDSLANLQLLEGIKNIEKSNKDFKEWLFETFPNEQARKEYMNKNYIPDIDLSIENFEKFIFIRRTLMAKRFSELLRL